MVNKHFVLFIKRYAHGWRAVCVCRRWTEADTKREAKAIMRQHFRDVRQGVWA